MVAFQIEMKRLAEEAARSGAALPARYHELYRRWFLLGWPAFAAVVAIYVLMLFKPTF